MDHFTWKDEYSVGDEALDKQHQELIRIMNDLYGLLNDDEGAQHEGQVEFIFGNLAGYIVSHFAYEEQRMIDARFPYEQLVNHRAEHHELIKKVRRYHLKVLEGNREGLKELLPYLYGEWLIHHICEQDMAYRPFLDAQRGVEEAAQKDALAR
jgi:hemerythrin